MRNDKNFSKISLKMNDRDEREEEKFNSNESLRTSRRTIEWGSEPDVEDVATKFTVTLKGVKEKDFLLNRMNIEEEEVEDEYKAVKRRLSDPDDDEEEEDEMMIINDDSPAKRVKIRCVFWPSCEKAENCPYLHPNKQCE